PGPQCFRVHTELVTDTAEDTAAGTRVGFEGVEDHADRSLTKLEGVFLLGHDREVLSVASLSPLFPGRINPLVGAFAAHGLEARLVRSASEEHPKELAAGFAA